MPLNAYGVLGTFVAAGTVLGSAIGWLVGPRRWWAAAAPAVAAVAALGTFGHRLKIGFGPTVLLFGFEVHLFSDLALAALAALAAAVVQRGVLAFRGGTPRGSDRGSDGGQADADPGPAGRPSPNGRA